MSRIGRIPLVATSLVSALCALALTGCSSSAPQSSGTLQHAELTFNLGQCQQQGPGLYKCPAIDKAICSPDYVGTDVQCIKVDKNGKIIVQQMEQ